MSSGALHAERMQLAGLPEAIEQDSNMNLLCNATANSVRYGVDIRHCSPGQPSSAALFRTDFPPHSALSSPTGRVPGRRPDHRISGDTI